MDKRTILLSSVTVVVLFIEILFFQSYNNIQILDYSARNNFFISEDLNLNTAKSFNNLGRLESARSGADEVSTSEENSLPQDQTISGEIMDSTEKSQNTASNGSISNNPSQNTTPNNSTGQNVLGSKPNNQPDYTLDFSKMADGTPINSMFRIQNGIDDNWHPEWNNEKQMYRPQNVKIENGSLVIFAKVESNGEISSGKVDTQGFFQAKYGRFDIVAKMPSGIGTFPAIWMLASNGSNFHDNIATPQEKQLDISWQGDGEIDIMEFLGVEPGWVFHDAHTFNSLLTKKDPYSGSTRINNPSTEFHTYSIDWKPNSITYLVDDVVKHTITKPSDNIRDWPFNTPFYLILNLAMGGEWNDSILSSQGKNYPKGIDNNNQSGWKMYIKSIKHYPM